VKGVRVAVMVVAYYVVTAAMWTGHVIVQLAGAADSIITAALGVPRLSYTARRVAEVMRETWKDSR
jgi:uncharacterized membrane protein